jgi:hypothetical protein
MTGVDERIWEMLVKYGVIDGNKFQARTEQVQEIAERLNAARAAVEGQGITAREATEKYGFSFTNIYRWRDEGWIRIIGTAEKYGAAIYNEGDMAFARTLDDIVKGTGKRRPIFPARPRSGRPRKNPRT